MHFDVPTFVSAISSFVASFVALWIACTEQTRIEKYRKKKIKKQNVDLILIPTKEWDYGAKYQRLISELTNLGTIQALAREELNGLSINDFHDCNQKQESLHKQIEYLKTHNIANDFFEGDIFILPPSEFSWINCERIYGVNIKEDVFVTYAQHRLIATQYFKDAFITEKGKKHDIALNKREKLKKK